MGGGARKRKRDKLWQGNEEGRKALINKDNKMDDEDFVEDWAAEAVCECQAAACLHLIAMAAKLMPKQQEMPKPKAMAAKLMPKQQETPKPKAMAAKVMPKQQETPKPKAVPKQHMMLKLLPKLIPKQEMPKPKAMPKSSVMPKSKAKAMSETMTWTGHLVSSENSRLVRIQQSVKD